MTFVPFDHLRLRVASQLQEAFAACFEPSLLPSSRDFYSKLERPKNPEHGDYAYACFSLAKSLAKSPQQIATTISEHINQLAGGTTHDIKSAAPLNGFLNLTLHAHSYNSELLSAIQSGDYFLRIPQSLATTDRVMIEYSQPNTHKAFHVGHIRNVALGDCLGRLYKYAGYHVTMANYLGDEGAHIAKCLWHILENKLPLPSEQRAAWLDEQYRAGSSALEALTDGGADENAKAKAKESISHILAAIESKSGSIYELWKETKEWSLADFRDIYQWFGAHFDHWFYESEVSQESQEIVDEYLAKGIFKEDDGAIGIDLSQDKLGFLILRKRDGNTLYATKDLALARRKFEMYQIDRSIYVVASEQNQHFRQVFKTLEHMGFRQAAHCFHLSYGMVTLPEGKMSTRSGNTVGFTQLRSEILKELDTFMEKYRTSWSHDEIESTKRHLAVGAIRFGMISSDPVKDIVFNLKDWLSFEGFSGPYLIYAYARTQSILTKAVEQKLQAIPADARELSHPDELALLRCLNDFNGAVYESITTNKPSILAHHLYATCKHLNRFLANCSVLKADDPKQSSGRIFLLQSFAAVLHTGLGLLGITPVARM